MVTIQNCSILTKLFLGGMNNCRLIAPVLPFFLWCCMLCVGRSVFSLLLACSAGIGFQLLVASSSSFAVQDHFCCWYPAWIHDGRKVEGVLFFFLNLFCRVVLHQLKAGLLWKSGSLLGRFVSFVSTGCATFYLPPCRPAEVPFRQV